MKVGFGKNKNRAPQDRIVGWGKYRGQLMSEVPTQYLQWFVRNAYHQMYARKVWAQEELDRRHDQVERSDKSSKSSSESIASSELAKNSRGSSKGKP